MDEIQHHQEYLLASDNTKLYTQSWLPPSQKAVVAIVHGYAEHSGRYSWIALQFALHGFAVHTFDLRGHGKSEGKRGTINSFNKYLDDLDVFLSLCLPHKS